MPNGNPAMSYLAAAIQMTAGPDKAANLDRAERLVRVGAARGADLVALPEVFNWRGKRIEQAAAAETLDGQSLTLMSRLARELRIHLVAGSITEQVAGESRCYNTSALLGPDGGQIAVYRKIHLFDVDLPGRVTVRESDSKLGGAQFVSARTPLGTIGLSICYDLRFPALYRRAERVHGPHRPGARGAAAPRPRDREPGVRDRARAVWSQCLRLQRLRQFNDRRSMGTRDCSRGGSGRCRGGAD